MNDSSECLSREAEDQLRCVIDAVTSNQKQQSYATAVVFLTFCSSLVFLMQAGFAMICSGCVRKKNVQNTMLKSLLDVCGSSIAFYFVGYAFAFGGDEQPGKVSFIGSSNFLLLDGDTANGDSRALLYSHWFFHFSFAATAGEYTHAKKRIMQCNVNVIFKRFLIPSFNVLTNLLMNSHDCCWSAC